MPKPSLISNMRNNQVSSHSRVLQGLVFGSARTNINSCYQSPKPTLFCWFIGKNLEACRNNSKFQEIDSWNWTSFPIGDQVHSLSQLAVKTAAKIIMAPSRGHSSKLWFSFGTKAGPQDGVDPTRFHVAKLLRGVRPVALSF